MSCFTLAMFLAEQLSAVVSHTNPDHHGGSRRPGGAVGAAAGIGGAGEVANFGDIQTAALGRGIAHGEIHGVVSTFGASSTPEQVAAMIEPSPRSPIGVRRAIAVELRPVPRAGRYPSPKFLLLRA